MLALVSFFGMISGLERTHLKCSIGRSNDKDACISDVLCYWEGGNDRFWNVRFYRDFHEKELEAAFSFLEFIQSRIPSGVGSDTSHWCLNGNGKFDTWSYYNNIQGASASNFPWKGVWKVKIPKRVAFFYVDNGSWADPYIG